MIKHSTYIIITIFVVLLFFWFQLILLNLIWNNEWVENAESPDVQLSPAALQVGQSPKPDDTVSGLKETEIEYYIIAPAENEQSVNIAKTLRLVKRTFKVYKSLDALPKTPPVALTGMLICEGNLDRIGDIEILFSYLEAGKTAIMTNVLDISAENYKKYQSRFGIDYTHGRYKQKDMEFLENVLISGLYFEAKLTVETNKVNINGKTRVYAVAHDEKIKEYYKRNPMIWRTYYKSGAIYIINCDIIKDFSYVGVTVGILGMDKDVFAYPIADAGVFMIDGLPYYSTENQDNIKAVYSHDIVQFQRDILWSDMVSIVKGLKVKYTFYPYVGTEQNKVESKLAEYFGKEMVLLEAEFGVYPSEIFGEMFPGFIQKTSLKYDSETATSKVSFDPGDFGYKDDMVSLPLISQGSVLDKGDIFKQYSVASGLGYVSHYLDLKDILKSKELEDKWTQYKLEYVRSVYPVSKIYEYLEYLTASEAAAKMAVYLNCDPQVEIGSDEIRIKADKAGSVSFIVRTLRDIVSAENCTYKKLKTGYYKVIVQDKDAVLHTKDPDADIFK